MVWVLVKLRLIMIRAYFPKPSHQETRALVCISLKIGSSRKLGGHTCLSEIILGGCTNHDQRAQECRHYE